MQQLPSAPESTYQEPALPETAPGFLAQPVAPPSAKIIEFPRFAWAPPPPPPDQLAEPVMDRPRILEVPEFSPPPPALGGITIEPVEVEQEPKRPGIDMPLQCAPVGLRIVAALTDGLIISIAATLFGLVFWKVTEFRPPNLQILGISGGIFFVFWAAYQYLLIVYSARTPGLLLARLELARFDGMPAKRSLRRWRVLASFLSAVSLGMGYVWVFLDEDSLCWHDRITRTYLAPRK
jgi:RDD family